MRFYIYENDLKFRRKNVTVVITSSQYILRAITDLERRIVTLNASSHCKNTNETEEQLKNNQVI